MGRKSYLRFLWHLFLTRLTLKGQMETTHVHYGLYLKPLLPIQHRWMACYSIYIPYNTGRCVRDHGFLWHTSIPGSVYFSLTLLQDLVPYQTYTGRKLSMRFPLEPLPLIFDDLERPWIVFESSSQLMCTILTNSLSFYLSGRYSLKSS